MEDQLQKTDRVQERYCASALGAIERSDKAVLENDRAASPNAAQVRGHMPEGSRQRSTPKALGLILSFGILYLATLTAIVIVPFWPLKVLLAAANAVALSILFIMGHDACHGAFTPSRRLNGILGRLAFLPSWHPYSGWEHAHNRVHHSWTNLRGKDYAWAPLTKAEYDGLSPLGRWRQRFYRSPLGFGAYYFFEVYLKRTIFPSRAFWGKGSKATFRFDCLLVAVFIVLQAAYLLGVARASGAAMSPLATLAVAQWLPFLFWNWLIGFLIFLHHTHPRVPWFDDREQWSFYAGQIQGTVHTVFPWGIDGLMQHIMDHTAHHADPRIPLYHLEKAQRSLELAYPDDVAVQHFNFKSLLQAVRVCQLYDFERHRWVSYSGEPTSGPTVWPLSAVRVREQA